VDPVRAALDDAEVRRRLLHQAVARLRLWRADRQSNVLDEADEAVQETCQRGVERTAEFDPARGDAGGWLHGILNLVLHERCRALRRAPLQPAASPAEWENLTAPMSGTDDPTCLHRLRGGIGEDDRRIVRMHHLDGLSHEQIATALSISIGASRLRLCRAMAELKKLAAMEGGQ
jgi:RNA polymerase sigma-70 factor (ECF subfamily)